MVKHCDKMVHVTACLGVFFAILSGIFYLVLEGMRSQILINLGEYMELKREWDTVPFTSVITIPASQSCPLNHPVLVAFDEWPGLNIACICTSDAPYRSEYGTKCAGKMAESSKCQTLNAIPLVYLGIIDNYKVCGKRAG